MHRLKGIAMKVNINGKQVELAKVKTVSELLSFMGVESAVYAVQLNGTFIRRPDYVKTVLTANDTVEVLFMPAGG